MSKYKLHFLYAISFLVITAGFLLSTNTIQNNQQAEAAPLCTASTVSIVHPPQNLEIAGEIPIDFGGSTDVVSVRFDYNGKLIGKAVQEPNSSPSWHMMWDTNYAPNGPGTLKAIVNLSNNTTCESFPVNLVINNGLQKQLKAAINPPVWSGYTNSNVFFELNFQNSNIAPEIPKFAIVQWQVSGRGSLTPLLLAKAKYNSGPEQGTGEVKATISYGGQTIDVRAQTEIQSLYGDSGSTSGPSDNTAPDDSTNTGSNSGPSSENDIDEEKEIEELEPIIEPKEAINKVLEQDTFVKSCVESTLGESQIRKLVEENRRPKPEEFNKYLACFSRQNYVLPSILAPVAPEEVKKQSETKDVSIKSIANGSKANDENNSERKTLVFSGVAKPNTNVLLYVFSEPLVLATTADDEGNWSYTLEDPLESGEHEVYAMVDRGDGVYERSSVSSFFIGTASASGENPNGLSLELITEPTIAASNRSTNIYIASTIGVVTFADVVLSSYLYFRFRNKSAPSTTTNIEPAPTDDESNYKNFINGQ